MVSPCHGQGSRHRCFGPGVIAGRGLHSSLVAWRNKKVKWGRENDVVGGARARRSPGASVSGCSHRTYGPPGRSPEVPAAIRVVRSNRFYHHRRRRRLRGGTDGCGPDPAQGRNRADSNHAAPRRKLTDEVTAAYAAPAPPRGGLETVGLPRRRGMVGADIPRCGRSWFRRSNRVQAPPTAKIDPKGYRRVRTIVALPLSYDELAPDGGIRTRDLRVMSEVTAPYATFGLAAETARSVLLEKFVAPCNGNNDLAGGEWAERLSPRGSCERR